MIIYFYIDIVLNTHYLKNMREYKHPDIDHTFIIEDVNMSEIIIDGIRVLFTAYFGFKTKKRDHLVPFLLNFFLHLKQLSAY